MGGDAAHRVHRHRPAVEAGMLLAAASVQGWAMNTGRSNATWPISAAMRAIVAAGMPQRSATASGA